MLDKAKIEDYIKLFEKYNDKEMKGVEGERVKKILNDEYLTLSLKEKTICDFIILEKDYSNNILTMAEETEKTFSKSLDEMWNSFTEEERKLIEEIHEIAKILTYQEAFGKATDIDKGLRADDERFRNSVKINHEEGTMLFFDGAFSEKYDDYYFVFTEHHGFYVYHEDDVSIRNYKRIWS